MSEEVIRDWLKAIQPGVEPSDSLVAELASAWAPKTLKHVFAGVMSLGKAAGRLGETMALLGHQEASFRQLREEIGIPRAAPPSSLPRVAVILFREDAWWSPGEWIPDIIDRAAGHDVMRQSGEPTAPLDEDWLDAAALDHVFVLGASEGSGAVPQAAAKDDATTHFIDRPERWLTPGPDLPHAVFEAASYLHGVSGVFSSTPDYQRH